MAAAYNEHILDTFYNGVMKEVLTEVGESLGGQVMKDLDELWRGFMAESKALEPALEIIEPASASDGTGSAAASALRMVTIQIKRSPQYGPGTIPMVVPNHTLKRGTSHDQLVKILESQEMKDALTLPVDLATKVVQQLIDIALESVEAGSQSVIPQLDGQDDDSTDEEDDEEDDEVAVEPGEDNQDPPDDDEDGLNTDDDLSSDLDENEGDWPTLFETENVVICQYKNIDKQGKNWIFKLESGLMHINGRDYLFNKADGSAQW